MNILYVKTKTFKMLWVTLILIIPVFNSCEDFVEVDSPNNQLIGSDVFENADTVDAAFAHIYSQLRENAFTDGSISGLSYLMGHYADELTLYSGSLPSVETYTNNTVLPSDHAIKKWWDTSYNLIYATNSILEGVENSTTLTLDEKSRFLGEAYFLRGFIHFYLVNLYGDIPYIELTDYRLNSSVSRLEESEVYTKIISDLLQAKSLLTADDTTFSNLKPNRFVASALLSRVYLYQEEWQMALSESLEIIDSGNYNLNSDLSQVFVKTSTETLWQLDSGFFGTNTKEAVTFIFVSGPPPNSSLSNFILNDFEAGDARFTNWAGSVSEGSETWYFPFKYKLNVPTGSTEECSILFRLAELYLISAEAHAQLGNLSEAKNLLNIIRDRAMLTSITSNSQSEILNAILKERQIEFFSELGHRFFDLKRNGRATDILSPIKPNWGATDLLLPIPDSELLLNPNLLPQNDGY
ncbi:RagB/SusD family nutrient uptake outer membrane protein [Winogradskyella wichelsiae]|uniref:RagB/SusD family nutrient uptake outer membrane protein n=1 Tax=Winogradskyella wichelsiae TaxID=2697007 RepID=UPI003EF2FE22